MVKYSIVNETNTPDERMVLEKFVVDNMMLMYDKLKLTNTPVKFTFGTEDTIIHLGNIEKNLFTTLDESDHLYGYSVDSKGNEVYEAVIKYTGVTREGLIFNSAYALSCVLADQYIEKYAKVHCKNDGANGNDYYAILFIAVTVSLTVAIMYSLSPDQTDAYLEYCIDTLDVSITDCNSDNDNDDDYIEWLEEVASRFVVMGIFEKKVHYSGITSEVIYSLFKALQSQLNKICDTIVNQRKAISYEQYTELENTIEKLREQKYTSGDNYE